MTDQWWFTVFDKHYFYMHGDIVEGGNSRIFALASLVAQTGAVQCKYTSHTRFGRLIDGLRFLISLLFDSNQTLLIHYSLFDTCFSKRIVSLKLIAKILGWIVEVAAKKNKMYLEVNDLPYEQALDLELRPNRMNVFDAVIFTRSPVNYIFPTTEIAKYAKSKYKILESRVSVIINGSWIKSAEKSTRSDYILPSRGAKFVYAGTLNRGRQISEMIQIFSESEHSLVLIGANGDWIAGQYGQTENIKYLGPMVESEAQHVVMQCDMGLIPYDNTRMYYDKSFPTKASFYITSGIPFLSTPLVELQKHFANDIVIYAELSRWREILSEKNLISQIQERTKNINAVVQNKFSWPFIWKKWMHEQTFKSKVYVPSNGE